jgi:hypothetical protein
MTVLYNRKACIGKLAIHATTITQEYIWMDDTPDFLTPTVATNLTHLFD